jgi:hypothetical protein
MFLAGSFQFARRFRANRLGFSLRALQFCLRSLERFMRASQILPCPLALGVGTLKILLRPLAIFMCTQQLFLRALMIRPRLLQILLCSFAIAFGPLQFFLRSFTFAMRALQILVRGLPLGLRSLSIGVCSFEVGLGALQIRLCTLPFSTCSFEIRLDATAFRCDGFFQFTPRLRCCVRGRLFGLAPRARHGLGQSAFDISSRRGDFRLEPRAPLRVNRIQFRRPPLFSVRVGALTRFMQCLFVALREIAEVGVQLGLKFGPNGVNDAAKLFLGH